MVTYRYSVIIGCLLVLVCGIVAYPMSTVAFVATVASAAGDPHVHVALKRIDQERYPYYGPVYTYIANGVHADPSILDRVYSVSYWTSDDEARIAVVTVLHSDLIVQALKSAGWHVQTAMVGRLIIGTRGAHEPKADWKALLRAYGVGIKDVFGYAYHIPRPDGVARIGKGVGLPGLEGTTVAAVDTGNSIVIQTEGYQKQEQAQQSEDQKKNDGVFFDIPVNAMPVALHEPIARTAKQVLADAGLINIRIGYIKDIIQDDELLRLAVRQRLDETKAALGAVGSTPYDAKRIIERLIQREMSLIEPQTATFTLPDGTLGQEVIPNTDISFTMPHTVDQDGCNELYIGTNRVYTCIAGSVVTLSADRASARKLILEIEQRNRDWIVNIAGRDAIGITWYGSIAAIRAIGSADGQFLIEVEK